MAKRIKFKYTALFEENGGEYSGRMDIECYTLEIVGDRTLKINGAIVKLDERIYDVKLVG